MQRKGIVAVLAVAVLAAGVSAWAQDVTKYVRYEHDGTVSYGDPRGRDDPPARRATSSRRRSAPATTVAMSRRDAAGAE